MRKTGREYDEERGFDVKSRGLNLKFYRNFIEISENLAFVNLQKRIFHHKHLEEDQKAFPKM